MFVVVLDVFAGSCYAFPTTNTTDAQVKAYQYGDAVVNAGPHAVSGATINGIYTKINYDLNGAIISYTPYWSAPKKFIAYNSINQPTKITVGTSLDDTNPIARDEFKYSPDGDRYYKKTTYQQSGSLRTEHTFYVGDYEVIIFDSGATYQSEKTQIGNLLHVRKTPFAGSPVELQYVVHRDHLGSTDVVTLSDGSVLANLAFEPFGARRNSSTLTSNITSPQLNDLFLKMDALPSDGYTGHEALDRTGFVHMNGRVYDPKLARFLSPDPLVQAPNNSQNWNRYSYVLNNPLKYTDPSGYKTETVCAGEGVYRGCFTRNDDDDDDDDESEPEELVVTGYADKDAYDGGIKVDISLLDQTRNGLSDSAPFGPNNTNFTPVPWVVAPANLAPDDPRLTVMSAGTAPLTVSARLALATKGGKLVRPAGVPKNWVLQAGKKEGHIKYVNPANRHDYVRVKRDGTLTQVRNGKAYDANGNLVDLKSPEAHGITQNNFIFRE